MSTKTTFKRISLVAVAALGAGVLSVAPASAAVTTATSFVYAGTVGTFTTAASVAVGTRTTVDLTSGFTAGGTDAVTLTAVLTTSPAAFNSVSPNAITAAAGGATFATAAAPTNGSAVATSAAVHTITATGSGAVSAVTTLGYTPTVPGIYVITTTLASGATVLAGGSLTHVWTINAGYSANTTYANKAFPTQGSNITTGWSGVAGGQATVRITGMAASTTYFVTTDTGAIVSGTGSDPNGRTGTVVNTNGTNLSGGFNFTTGSATVSDSMDVKVTDTGSPATTTVTVKTVNAATGAASTFAAATVTWGAAAVVSTQYSLLTLNTTNGTTATGAGDDTSLTTASMALSSTPSFTIQIVLKDQYNVASVAGKFVTASITGPGTLGIATSNSGASSAGRALTSTALSDGGVASVAIFSDGTAGKAVVTLSSGTVALGTKTVTFFGAATTATATQNNFVAKAATQLGRTPSATFLAISTTTATSTGTNAAAFTVDVTDANGNAVTGSTYKIVSSDSTKIVAGTCAELTVGADASPGTWECSVSGAVAAASGASATVTFSVYSPATKLYDIVAAPLTFTVGGAMATLAVTLDKVSYGAADRMILSAVAKDSSGNTAFDGQAAYTSVGSNKSVVTLPTNANRILNGKTATSATSAAGLFAPVTSGSFTISGLTGGTATAPTGAAFSVTATVAADTATSDIAQAAADAAAEATDAANAATDAANAAAEAADAATAAAQDAADAVAALSTQVAEQVNALKMQNDALRKQLVAITNLIIKIQKKVKA